MKNIGNKFVEKFENFLKPIRKEIYNTNQDYILYTLHSQTHTTLRVPIQVSVEEISNQK